MGSIDVIARFVVASYWLALGAALNAVMLVRGPLRIGTLVTLGMRSASVGFLAVAANANDDCTAGWLLAIILAGLLVYVACVFDAAMLAFIHGERLQAASG